MRKSLLTISLSCLVCGLDALSILGPEKQIEDVQFGTVVQSCIVEQFVELDAPAERLVGAHVSASCSCSASSIGVRTNNGWVPFVEMSKDSVERLELRIILDTNSKAGAVRETVNVLDASRESAIAQIAIIGNVEPLIRFDPEVGDLGYLQAGESLAVNTVARASSATKGQIALLPLTSGGWSGAAKSRRANDGVLCDLSVGFVAPEIRGGRKHMEVLNIHLSEMAWNRVGVGAAPDWQEHVISRAVQVQVVEPVFVQHATVSLGKVPVSGDVPFGVNVCVFGGADPRYEVLDVRVESLVGDQGSGLSISNWSAAEALPVEQAWGQPFWSTEVKLISRLEDVAPGPRRSRVIFALKSRDGLISEVGVRLIGFVQSAPSAMEKP